MSLTSKQVRASNMLLLMMTLTLSCGRGQGEKRLCSEPLDLEDRLHELQRQESLGGLHDSFQALPLFQELIKNNSLHVNHTHSLRKRHGHGQVKPQAFSGSNKCPDKDDDVNDPCPTYSAINSDVNRYPRIMMTKECRCRDKCLGIFTKDRNTKAACEPIHHHVRALRRLKACKNGEYQYIPVWEKLNIGCTCNFVKLDFGK